MQMLSSHGCGRNVHQWKIGAFMLGIVFARNHLDRPPAVQNLNARIEVINFVINKLVAGRYLGNDFLKLFRF